MTGAIFYPPADKTTQWFGPSNATVPPNKILWHTMETLGWPGYNNGGAAPNLGYDPWNHIWRQHFPLNGTSRALANGADGYATNRKGVCQVEIAATNGWNATLVSRGRAIWNLDNQALDDLGNFSEFMNREWGVPLSTGVDWPKYPVAPKRLTRAQYEAYRGHLGHMHAPDQDHGDPGNLNIQAVLGGTVDMTDVNIVSMNEQVYERIAWWVLVNYKFPMIQPVRDANGNPVSRPGGTYLAERGSWNEEYTFRAANEAAARTIAAIGSLEADIKQAIADDPDADVDPAVVERAVAAAFSKLTATVSLESPAETVSEPAPEPGA